MMEVNKNFKRLRFEQSEEVPIDDKISWVKVTEGFFFLKIEDEIVSWCVAQENDTFCIYGKGKKLSEVDTREKAFEVGWRMFLLFFNLRNEEIEEATLVKSKLYEMKQKEKLAVSFVSEKEVVIESNEKILIAGFLKKQKEKKGVLIEPDTYMVQKKVVYVKTPEGAYETKGDKNPLWAKKLIKKYAMRGEHK